MKNWRRESPQAHKNLWSTRPYESCRHRCWHTKLHSLALPIERQQRTAGPGRGCKCRPSSLAQTGATLRSRGACSAVYEDAINALIELLAQCPHSPSQHVGIRPRGFGAARRPPAVGILRLKISATVRSRRSRRATRGKRRARQPANPRALRLDPAAPRSLLVRRRSGTDGVTAALRTRGPGAELWRCWLAQDLGRRA